MTVTEETPRSVSHYRWAVTLQAPGRDPVTVKGTMTSIATPEEDARCLQALAERTFRKKHPDQAGPVSVLSFTLEPDEITCSSCGWCRDPGCTGDHSGDATAAPWPEEPQS